MHTKQYKYKRFRHLCDLFCKYFMNEFLKITKLRFLKT